MGTTSFLTRAQRLLRIRNQLVRECLAEVLATFVMMVSRARSWHGAGGVVCVCVTGLMVSVVTGARGPCGSVTGLMVSW